MNVGLDNSQFIALKFLLRVIYANNIVVRVNNNTQNFLIAALHQPIIDDPLFELLASLGV
jgi:hypothetical protein